MELTTIIFLLGLGAGLAIIGIVLLVKMLLDRRWNIPVVIFRHVGDKRRPPIKLTKARKIYVNGGMRLIVKGFKRKFADYQQDNYYPSDSGKGALVLWEFEDAWLAPLRTAWKQLTPEQRKRADQLVVELKSMTNNVDFEYDSAVHDSLKLQIVDDVDSETFIAERKRIKTQYQSWTDWIRENAGWFVVVVVAVLLFAGWVVFLNEDPSNAAMTCIAQIRGICSDAWNVTISQDPEFGKSILERAAASASPSRPPG